MRHPWRGGAGRSIRPIQTTFNPFDAGSQLIDTDVLFYDVAVHIGEIAADPCCGDFQAGQP